MSQSQIVIACNAPPLDADSSRDLLYLEYRDESAERNITLALPRFVRQLVHLPPRVLDLLEIAAYVYCADRYLSRGPIDAVEFDSWSRDLSFHVAVRDIDFWQSGSAKGALCAALTFMTGDAPYEFTFYPGHATPASSLFDSAEFAFDMSNDPPMVSLFSGGLDSTAGAIRALTSTQAPLLLVSHQTQPGSKRTQAGLVQGLADSYPGRLHHYQFECHLTGKRAREESQRSRFFLYGSVAFAVATAFGLSEFHVFENGVTSINLPRRQDLLNARATRTTHPKSVSLMREFLTLVHSEPFEILTPFLYKTKCDVVRTILESLHPGLISSTVSCSRTFKPLTGATHCGECIQCVERRLAASAAGASSYDHGGLYSVDLANGPFSSRDAKTTVVDYLRQAGQLAESAPDHFHDSYVAELAEVIPYMGPGTELERIEIISQLFQRHGEEVFDGVKSICDEQGNLLRKPLPNSLLGLVADREYLSPAVERLMASIINIVDGAVPQMFRKEKPVDERDFNAKIGALLGTHAQDLRSEHPTVSFACAGVIPDHQLSSRDVIIESKYLRGKTTPAKVTDGMASDLTKYPQGAAILFLVYDPERAIPKDSEFRDDFESKGRCRVCLLR